MALQYLVYMCKVHSVFLGLTSSDTKSPNRSSASTQVSRRQRSSNHRWFITLICMQSGMTFSYDIAFTEDMYIRPTIPRFHG